jgi:hypothetical protein
LEQAGHTVVLAGWLEQRELQTFYWTVIPKYSNNDLPVRPSFGTPSSKFANDVGRKKAMFASALFFMPSVLVHQCLSLEFPDDENINSNKLRGFVEQ